MKIGNSTPQGPIGPTSKSKAEPKEPPTIGHIVATGMGVRIRKQPFVQTTISHNEPTDPLVSKKILDSLDLGLINFNQAELDVLSKIMNSEK